MADEVKDVKETKKKSNKELLAANLEDLSTDEVARRTELVRAMKEEADLQDIKERLADRDNKRTMQTQGFLSKGQELKKIDANRKVQEAHCTHRKGGKGLEALSQGGSDAMYSVIRHLMPWNEVLQRCQRCGKTWKPPHEQDFNMKSEEGKAAFSAAKEEYRIALSWPTDNTMSTSHTFQFHSEDGDITARKFVHDAVKDVNLR